MQSAMVTLCLVLLNPVLDQAGDVNVGGDDCDEFERPPEDGGENGLHDS